MQVRVLSLRFGDEMGLCGHITGSIPVVSTHAVCRAARSLFRAKIIFVIGDLQQRQKWASCGVPAGRSAGSSGS